MFTALARFVTKRPTVILYATTVLFIISVVLGVQSFGKLQSGGVETPSSQSTTARNLMGQNFGGETNIVFLVHIKQADVDSPVGLATGQSLTNKLSSDPTLASLASYWQTHNPALRSTDQHYGLITARIKPGGQTARAKALIKLYTTDTSGYSVQIGGSIRANIDITNQVGSSLARSESLAVPLTLILLLFAFGTVMSALLPLVIAVLAVFGTFAELYILGSVTNISIYSVNLVTALGLGLAIDYALFIVSRYREELASGKQVEAAIIRTIQTAGRTVLFSAVAVSAALATMAVFPLYFLTSFAYAGVGVVAISAVSALVVLPAILLKLGHRVEKGRLPWAHLALRVEAPFWRRLAEFVMRRPFMTAGPVMILLLVIALPLGHISFGTPDDRVLSKDTTTHQIGDVLRTKFATNGDSQVNVVVQGRPTNADIAQYSESLSKIPQINDVATSTGTYVRGVRVSTIPRLPSSPSITALNLDTNVDPQSTAGGTLIKTIRALPGPANAQVFVGGNAAELVDTKAAIGSRLGLGASLIVISTFVILFLFTGSILQPLRALLSNGLTLAAAFGAVVWIFQDGHLSSVLGFTPLPIYITMPILLFCIAFGLSMDYEVFLLSRIKEQYDAGAKTTDAVAHGMARAGRIVSTLATILAVSFFAFGVASINFLQLFGIGTGFAILIDATLVRGILVPAFMHFLGKKAWYAPPLLEKLYNRARIVDEG